MFRLRQAVKRRVEALDRSRFFLPVAALVALVLAGREWTSLGDLSTGTLAQLLVAALLLPLFPLHGIYLGALTRLPRSLVIVLAVLMYGLHHRQAAAPSRAAFLRRLGATYAATLVISAALLYGVDRFEPWDDLLTALRRTILVAFPASFAATVVDNLGSAIDSGRG